MRNLPCQKRRHIIVRNKDGNKEEVYRCANGITKHYRSIVNESVCKSCTLRQPLLKLASICREHPPKNSIWPEPYYQENGDIIYPLQEGVQAPPVSQGYKQSSENSWHFETEWDECPYRQLMNLRTPKGNLQIHAYCIARKDHAVKHEECKKCLIDMAKIDGSLNEKNIKNSIPLPEPIKERLGKDGIPNYPGAVELLDNYWQAVKRWIAAGRPIRENAEVQNIHAEFCISCDWYDSESQRCKGCGCKVKPKGTVLLNKIKMKTEHCPRKFW